jgi:hypothetical protein
VAIVIFCMSVSGSVSGSLSAGVSVIFIPIAVNTTFSLMIHR